MSIKRIREPDIYLTEGEERRLRYEYERTMRFHAGPPISFEEYIRAHAKDATPLTTEDQT